MGDADIMRSRRSDIELRALRVVRRMLSLVESPSVVDPPAARL
jgi:hypothetical protein